VPNEDECFNFRGDPSKLNPQTGIIEEGCIVEEGDILIGKTVASNDKDTEYRCKSKQNVSVVYDSKIQGESAPRIDRKRL
jgi:DNA-directed RNA polymerase beta subunit